MPIKKSGQIAFAKLSAWPQPRTSRKHCWWWPTPVRQTKMWPEKVYLAAANLKTGCLLKPRVSPASSPRMTSGDWRREPHCVCETDCPATTRSTTGAKARKGPTGAVRRKIVRMTTPEEECLGSFDVAKPASRPSNTHKTKPAMYLAILRITNGHVNEMHVLFHHGGLFWTV